MISFDFVTGDKENERSPFGKPRIFFTCHPDDFCFTFPGDRTPCFEKICNDIFNEVDFDCAVFYALDREIPFEEGEIENALGSMDIFVIAVSTRLLFSPDSAPQVYQVLKYARESKKYIIPILMEIPTSSLLEKYSDPEFFGNLQYIDPHDTGKNTPYIQLLSASLSEHTVSADKIEIIRSAFTSSVFLSYRKVDRKYAENLMRFIHDDLGSFDVAVWYDEFLPIGENWRSNISRAMDDVKQKSNLFLLLVTPNVLEAVDGKDNFVTREECPEAKEKGMKILPVEILPTDYLMLKSKINYIPPFVRPESDEFNNELKLAAYHEPIKEKTFSFDTLCNIGLAYYFGINAERNIETGIRLLNISAAGGYKEAMEHLYKIAYICYENGDCSLAEEICIKLNGYFSDAYGEYSDEAIRTQMLLIKIGLAFGDLDKIRATVAVAEKILDRLPSESELGITLYIQVASGYNTLGMTDEAVKNLKLAEARLDEMKIEGEGGSFYRNKIKLTLSDIYFKEGEYEKSLEIRDQLLTEFKKSYRDDYRDVILIRDLIARVYDKIGQSEKALGMHREILKIKRESKYFGPESLSTLLTMADIIVNLEKDGCYEEALSLADEGARIGKSRYPELAPVELLFETKAYGIFLHIVKKDDSYKERMFEHMDKVYALRKKVRKSDTNETLVDDRMLAVVYHQSGNLTRALEVFEKTYEAALRLKDDEGVGELVKTLAKDMLEPYFTRYQEYLKDHNIKMANVYLAKLYEISLSCYGPFHSVTMEWQRRLTEAKSKKKKGKKKK